MASTAERRHAAAKLGLDESAMRQMATAFEHEQAEDARRLVSTT